MGSITRLSPLDVLDILGVPIDPEEAVNCELSKTVAKLSQTYVLQGTGSLRDTFITPCASRNKWAKTVIYKGLCPRRLSNLPGRVLERRG